MTDHPLFETRGLGVTYPGRGRRDAPVHALREVDLTWAEGEVLGLVGASGSGKSTLGRTLTGLREPSHGTLLFGGEELTGRRDRTFRRQVQMVFQDPYQSLNPRRTVGSQVMEGLDIHGIGASEEERVTLAVTAMERCGLAPADRYWHRYPHELSGGQRQRVVIAAAVVLGPRALICDEPVSALDVSIRSQVLGLLAELRRTEGISLLFITHDVGLAWALCERVAVLHQGSVAEYGDTEQVLGSPRHPYTRELLAAAPAPPVRR
ncbi:peptide ABC transporter ATP-binding protein [Streptomyces spongiicola]|uniref:Peptide ABC transporter ATP-binding protein n=1 Tax=Streptomyces spongiicola TaxID=1690221 RepID=A0ABM6VCG7_9ACTN|nr:ABC transporter ATP-binding protein [Streptomyces spongiicola]AWK11715.1 peptide ABC transporter ATP-binding protein [Streptomyces spongiicola]